MTRYVVELSLENVPAGQAEVAAVADAVGARPSVPAGPGAPEIDVETEDPSSVLELGRRLSFARRIVEPWPATTEAELLARFRGEGSRGARASLRPHGRPGAPISEELARFARAYVEGGGAIDLERPERTFYLAPSPDGRWFAAELRLEVPRRLVPDRRMPTLPFRRPVSLPPKLGRLAVNLGAVRPGDRVADPFVGTGALALEAALLGATLVAVDRDPAMVRGAIRNLAAFDRSFDGIAVADAAAPPPELLAEPLDAVVTDPPYGRSSGSGGEPPAELLARALPVWAERVRAGGRVSVVVPGGPDPLPPPWRRVVSVPDRVHRSLTREFRVYTRA